MVKYEKPVSKSEELQKKLEQSEKEKSRLNSRVKELENLGSARPYVEPQRIAPPREEGYHLELSDEDKALITGISSGVISLIGYVSYFWNSYFGKIAGDISAVSDLGPAPLLGAILGPVFVGLGIGIATYGILERLRKY